MGAKVSIKDMISNLLSVDAFKDENIQFVKREGYKYYFSHTCRICESDVYSQNGIGNNTFIGNYSVMCKGSKYCRCNKRAYKLNEDQIRLRVSLECNKNNVQLLGWLSDYSGYKTKCKLICKKHKQPLAKSITINNILHKTTCSLKCKICRKEFELNERQKVLTSLLRGTNYIGFAGKNAQDIYVICEKCSFDEFTTNGLCSGVFKTTFNNLRRGSKCCRCSLTPTYTKEMRRYQIERLMKEEDSLTFVDWTTEYTDVDKTRFSYSCEKHGESECNLNNFINNGRRCKGCRNEKMQWRVYKDRYNEIDNLYTLSCYSEEEEFLKIGRTFNVNKRESDYNVIPYITDYEVILSDVHYVIYWLEQKLHRYFKEYHYQPDNPFGGSKKECFSVSKDIVLEKLEEFYKETLIDYEKYKKSL